MAEKAMAENTDMRIIEQMEHRVLLLLQTDKDVNSSYTEQKKTLTSQEGTFDESLKIIKEEIAELQQTTQELRKAIYLLGHQLKDKTNKRALESVQEKIDNWPLEGYITKKELPELFEKYAKEKQE